MQWSPTIFRCAALCALAAFGSVGAPGVVAPVGTPKEIVERLSTDLDKIKATPEFREQLVEFGMEPFAAQTSAQFGAMIVAEQPWRAKAIRESGAKVD